ncbi:Host specificity protein J [Shigella sonnei]|nr:Host specificity protein J [Shigella sonnei]
MNTVGKSAFVEAIGRASDDAEGYLNFYKGLINKTHLGKELWTQIDNGQLAPDLTEIRTSITNVSNEITQTVNKKLENQSAAIQQIQKVQVDTNNNLNSMWAVKLQQMKDGRLYIAGIGAGIENTPAGMQSQVLLAADRIAMINPANGNTKPMFVGQGDQIFMNDVFLKCLTAPTITSGGNPPAFSLTPPTVQFEFWFSEKRITDIRQVETTARYLGTALYWIAASINIKPGHDYYFYIRSVNTVGKSAFVEAVGRASDDAEGYLDFFKGEIGKTHLAQELWTQIDNGQLAPDLAEIRTSITNVSNEITQTVNKKLEDQSAAIQQIQKVQVDTNNNLNSMWAVKLQQMKDGRLYIAGIGAGIENTPAGMQSQVLLAADRIAMINPANGNTKPMFVGQGDQIFMNDVFLKCLTAPTITSGGNPPAFSLTPDGRLTAKNADISGNVNANSGTLNNVTINENCRVLGKLSANQIEGDLVKTVGKAFPRDSRAPERWPSGTITVRVYDDQPFDRQIVIPAVAFSGAKHERENNDIYSSCRLIVRKNGAEIYNRTALDNTLIYSGVIDMPAGRGHMTLEFSVSAWLVNNWYPTASISDLLVVVMKKATAGISIS